MSEFFFRKRPDGTLGDVYWTNLFGVRVSTGQKNIRNATTWKHGKEREGADPRHAASQKARLDDAIRELKAELRRRGRAAATLKRADEKLGHLVRLWGEGCRLSTVDARTVGQFIDARLQEGASRLTIRDELAFLRQMLKLARRQGLYPLAIEDVMPLQFETGHKPRKDYIPEARVQDLLEHVVPRHAAHILFFCVCGGRLSDSYRARREDFDTSKWRIHVRGSKTEGSLRTIPVPEFVRPWVRRLLKDAEGEDILFRSWPNFNRDLKAACQRAGLEPVSTNGLRRTFGHALRAHGFDLDTISKLFGHTTAKLVRDVYADVEGEELAQIVANAESRYKTGTRTHKSPRKAR